MTEIVETTITTIFCTSIQMQSASNHASLNNQELTYLNITSPIHFFNSYGNIQTYQIMKALFCFLLFSFALFGSGKLYSNNNLVNGKGYLRSEFRKTTPFSGIDSHIFANINIIKSKIRNVEIIAQDNILPLIQLTERNGLLIITTGAYSIQTDSTVTINIYLPSINEICLSGEGNISSECPVSKVFMSGMGNIYIVGKTRNITILHSGSGNINLLGMKVVSAHVSISGSGSVKLYVKEKLDISVTGTGMLWYKGEPSINLIDAAVENIICLN